MSGLRITLRGDRERTAATEEDGEIMDDAQDAGMQEDAMPEEDESERRRGTRHTGDTPPPPVAASAAPAASAFAAASAAPASRPVVVKTKGRGFKSNFSEQAAQERYAGKAGEFESLMSDDEGSAEAVKSVEGWILMVSGLHEESNEDDLYDLFADHGEIKQLHLNLDRRTGYVKGYALVQYGEQKEAQAAISALQGHALHDKPITIDWAFKPAPHARSGRGRGPRGGRR